MRFHPYKKNITKTTCTKKRKYSQHKHRVGSWADSGRWHRSKGVIGGHTHRMRQQFGRHVGVESAGGDEPSGEGWGAISCRCDIRCQYDAPRASRMLAELCQGGL